VLATAWAVAVATVACALAGCTPGSSEPPATAGYPDQPVPASEPRAELKVVVDLPAMQGCEETLDLALYANRAVELVVWDDARRSCEQRRVAIRYLSAHITPEQLLDAVRAHAAHADLAKEPAQTHGPAPQK